MKYKIGDRVEIKTWGQLEKEFGIHSDNDKWIDCPHLFTTVMEKELESLGNGRVVTISDMISIEKVENSALRPNIINECDGDYYVIEEFGEGRYTDCIIKCKTNHLGEVNMFLAVNKIECLGLVGSSVGSFFSTWIEQVSIAIDKIKQIKKHEETGFIVLTSRNDSKIVLAHTESEFNIALGSKNMEYLIDNFDKEKWLGYKRGAEYGNEKRVKYGNE